MVEILRGEELDGRRIRLDGLRLSWRTVPIRLAVGQFQLRYRRPVWISEGLLLLLQGMVAPGALAASLSALELARQGRQRDSGLGVFQPGRSGIAGKWQVCRHPEGSASRPYRVEGKVRAGRD